MRDSSATVLGSLALFSEKIPSSIDAEGLAIQKAMHWAADHNILECQFETDSAEAYNLIQGFNQWSLSYKEWVADCATMLIKYDKWNLSVIRREANRMADALAKKAAIDGWIWSSIQAIPIFLGDKL